MKSLLKIFLKKKKGLTSSFKLSEFQGKYHENSSPPLNSQASISAVTADAAPPPYIPIAREEAPLPEHYAVKSSKAAWIRFFIQITQLAKLLVVLLIVLGVVYLLINLNQQYQIVASLVNYMKTLRIELINGSYN